MYAKLSICFPSLRTLSSPFSLHYCRKSKPAETSDHNTDSYCVQYFVTAFSDDLLVVGLNSPPVNSTDIHEVLPGWICPLYLSSSCTSSGWQLYWPFSHLSKHWWNICLLFPNQRIIPFEDLFVVFLTSMILICKSLTEKMHQTCYRTSFLSMFH